MSVPASKFVPFLRSALLGLVLAVTAGGMASAAEKQDNVSASIAKTLKASQDALQAKNFPEAIAKAKEAEAASGPKTEYDRYVINSLLMSAYIQTQNLPAAAEATEAVLATGRVQGADKIKMLKGLLYMYVQNKDYDKALNAIQRAEAAGDTSDDLQTQKAALYQRLGKSDELIASLKDIISKAEKSGKRPTEASLIALWNALLKSKRPDDVALRDRTVEKLITYYPKPDYWRNAVGSVKQNLKNDDHLTLHLYRLLSIVGVLSKGEDYREAAQIALDQGNPGEAQALMEQAFSKNLFSDAEKASNTRLLNTAKEKAAADKASLAKYEAQAAKAASGDALVQIGGAYVGYGQPDKAAEVIAAGIAKGNLKNANDAYMLLGYAYSKAGKDAEAAKAFNKVTGDTDYVRVAKLWLLHVH